MKKTKIPIYAIPVLLLILLTSFGPWSYGTPPAKQQYFELKIYRIKDAGQAANIDKYLKEAFIPAMHKAGIPKVGVFKPVEADTAFGKLIYVFIPYKTADQYFELVTVLENDRTYQTAGKDFIDAPYNNPPFTRYESIFMKAFSHMPEFRVPTYSNPASERIYELRSYESATDAKAVKKIEMFNQGGEINIFKKLNFNPVFWGEVLIGSHMPNLMYMTTFSDMKTHDEQWKAFGATDEWKKLSGMEEYKNTVSKAKPYLLHPTSYSDF